jgi:hypothetical protein
MDPGDPALLRHVFRGRVGWALPCIVVEDTPSRVALFRQPGTLSKSPTHGSVEELVTSLAEDTFDPADSTWRETFVVELAPVGRAHSVWPMWSKAWRFLGWYVNLQEPMRRSRFGYDTFDQFLDITVSPHLTWRWKDEDHWVMLREHGVLTPAEADAVRREGEAVIEDIEARRAPFNEPWPEWRPDPSWGMPTLPDDWDVL